MKERLRVKLFQDQRGEEVMTRKVLKTLKGVDCSHCL